MFCFRLIMLWPTYFAGLVLNPLCNAPDHQDASPGAVRETETAGHAVVNEVTARGQGHGSEKVDLAGFEMFKVTSLTLAEVSVLHLLVCVKP